MASEIELAIAALEAKRREIAAASTAEEKTKIWHTLEPFFDDHGPLILACLEVAAKVDPMVPESTGKANESYRCNICGTLFSHAKDCAYAKLKELTNG